MNILSLASGISRSLSNRLALLISAWVSLLLLFPVSVLGETQEHIYTFGVVPQFDALRTRSIWRPILDELEKSTGLKFTLRGSTNIPNFEQEFSDGAFDFVYMNPYHVLLANKKQGYLPLVRDTGNDLYGIVVVRKDSAIQKVEDLDGKLVAFPAPNSLGASLMIRADFYHKFNIQVIPKYVNTHTSVYLNVLLGEVEAGGGVQKTLAEQRPEVRDALRVLYETERFASHPICSHPRIPEGIREQVRQALLAMGTTESGRALLSHIPIEHVGPADIVDYTPIGKLGLEVLYQD